MRLNILSFQRCNNWSIVNHAGFLMTIELLLSNFTSNYLHDRALLMSQRSGILLFNSRGTCAHCLGSRRCFNVKMSFTDDDRILIEIYTFLKVTVQTKKLIKEFPDRGLALSSLNKLLKKLWNTSTTARRSGSGRPRTERIDDNVNTVNDLILIQEDAPETHRSTRQIARETGIHHSSV